MQFVAAEATPYSDGRRVKLHFVITPFLERPNIDVSVTNLLGQEVAALSLIEAMETEHDFTLHLRGPQPQGEYTVHLCLFYSAPTTEPPSETAPQDTLAEREIATEHRFTFTIAAP